MPTHADYPWLQDERARRVAADPKDPVHAALVYESKQIAAIDDAREATSQPPPPPAK